MNGNEKKESDRYKDFYLSCYLKAVGVPLVTVEKAKGIAYFCFEKNPEIKRIIEGFYNGQGMVSANNLVNAIRDLKALIYNL